VIDMRDNREIAQQFGVGHRAGRRFDASPGASK
jgi:hypothetical protein